MADRRYAVETYGAPAPLKFVQSTRWAGTEVVCRLGSHECDLVCATDGVAVEGTRWDIVVLRLDSPSAIS